MRSIQPTEIRGLVRVPSSKSMTIRAYICASLANGKSTFQKPSRCDDALMALSVARELGANIEEDSDIVHISGGSFVPLYDELDCGESGLLMRIMAPLLALKEQQYTLIGKASLLNRPMDMLEEPLKAMGANCITTNGLPPVVVQGPLAGGDVEIDGSITSQFLTGLLMALPLCKDDSTIKINDLQSKPYINLTRTVLKLFGVTFTDNLREERINIPGGQEYQPVIFKIPGDWSSGAFLMVAGAIAGKTSLTGLSYESPQGDKVIVDVLKEAGAKVEIGKKSMIVEKDKLEAFNFDASDCPDLFPPLTVLALNCDGVSKIKGVHRLVSKESDRGAVLVNEFKNLGSKIKIEGDELIIKGGQLIGGTGNSNGDHRIAMALAIAALTSEEGIDIEDEQCVTKSYPNFFDDLKTLTVVKE